MPDRREPGQHMTVDGESKHKGLDAGGPGEFRLVIPSPRPMPGLRLQSCRVESPSEISVWPALEWVNAQP